MKKESLNRIRDLVPIKKTDHTYNYFKPFFRDNAILTQLIVSEIITLLSVLKSKKIAHVQLSALISEEGSLTSLKNYTKEYIHNMTKPGKEAISFYQLIIRIWSIIWQGCESIPPQSSLKIVQSLKPYLQELKKSCIPLIKPYRQDEKVILFLLKQQPSITSIFGHEFIRNMFQISSEKDRELLYTLLKKYYSEKGFDNLIPSLETQLNR